ncbi:hypothetical protein LVD15_04065 [Fulvivirga maritima]|uniref:bestrophin family protein n=1 Tax=Fulvivirga maritima TaxID=2904247 RepID=UPI001F1AABE0|nr:bestrophin family ion channel [Fulvivirga maritima]UII27611.1 hypothetical protein LVD15_04065 [Fulvivirga maritima]
MILKKNIPISYIISELKTPLISVTLIAIASVILPLIFGSFFSEIPINIATTLGVAISILLSYMINQSYERWWEARKIWGEIVNDSRTLVLQLQMYLHSENRAIHTMSLRQISWCYCLGRHLRKTESMNTLKQALSESDFEHIKNHLNIPLSILSLQSASLKRLLQSEELDKFSQIRIEETLARLTASMGKCERIKNTVFPSIYRYGLHATIYLFVVFLSLSVAFELQHFILQFFILLIVSAVFFFLEKAAFRMQDPFENIATDTPMTAIAETIESNIMELLNKEVISAVNQENNKFYVL